MVPEMHFRDRIGEDTDPSDCALCHTVACFACVHGYCTALEKLAAGPCAFYKDAEENRREIRRCFYRLIGHERFDLLYKYVDTIYYSKHHGNTKKLLDAIKAADPGVVLIDVTEQPAPDLSAYDRIGMASGIYYSGFARQIIAYADTNLPENKDVFYIYTHGAPGGSFLKGIRAVAEKKHCREISEYRCQGYDTFGPFKLVGGIAKGHPTGEEIQDAVAFYRGLAGTHVETVEE